MWLERGGGDFFLGAIPKLQAPDLLDGILQRGVQDSEVVDGLTHKRMTPSLDLLVKSSGVIEDADQLQHRLPLHREQRTVAQVSREVLVDGRVESEYTLPYRMLRPPP